MFWGLVLEPAKKYSRTVDNSFRLTSAVLDTSISENGIVRVFLVHNLNKHLIGNLSMKSNILQIPLDLQFMSGDEIAFFTAGAKIPVHLCGYLVPDEDDTLLENFNDSDELDEEEEEEEEDNDTEVPELVKAAKRKLADAEENMAKKKKIEVNGVVAADKSPLLKNFSSKLNAINEDEETDPDDSEFEEDDDDDDDDDDEDDDNEAEEEAEEEEEEDVEEEETKVAPVEVEQGKKNNKVKQLKTESGAVTTPKSEKKKVKTEEAAPVVKSPQSEKKPKPALEDTPKSEKKNKNKTPMKAEEPIVGKTPKSEKKKKKKAEALAMENGKSPNNSVAATSPASKSPNAKPKVTENESPSKPTKIVKPGGIIVEDLRIGSGAEVKNGKHVSMYYEGKLKGKNKTFDKTVSGPPFKFRLGSGEVIKGWDVGVQGMKVGGKRRLTIPPHMGYGKSGALPAIPPNATLIFDVEVKGTN